VAQIVSLAFPKIANDEAKNHRGEKRLMIDANLMLLCWTLAAVGV
jgi:hypothetical protein